MSKRTEAKRKKMKKVANKQPRKQPNLKPAEFPPKERAKMLKAFAGDSPVQPVPSLTEALALQEIEKEPEFKTIQAKIIDWYKNQTPTLLKSEGRLDYLPDKVISFVIPLDFYVSLPENYLSGIIGGTKQEIDSLSCVGNFAKVIPVGKLAIKISYLVVSICDDDSIRLMNLGTSAAIGKIFYKAVELANQVIAGLQAVPNRHSHLMHPITAYSCPGTLDYFVFDRRGENDGPRSYRYEWRDDVAVDIAQNLPLKEKDLELFKVMHTGKAATNDKVFKLISLYQHAVNSRCYGNDDQAILDADTFVEYTIGYLYCELRLYRGDDAAEVYEDYKGMRRTNKIWDALAKMLDFKDAKSLKQAVDYDDWDVACHTPRNHLHHSFMTEPHDERESGVAVYKAGILVYKLCDIVVGEVNDPEASITMKAQLLQSSTLFFKHMIETLAKADSVKAVL